MNKTNAYFTQDEDYIYINSEYAEAYIPNDLFTSPDDKLTQSAMAYEYGNGFCLLALFYMRFFKSDKEDRDKVPLKTMVYPTMIETYPSEFTKARLDLDGSYNVDDGEEPPMYRILKYYKGDIMMSVDSTKSVVNCEKFMSLLNTGRIPSSMTYDQVYFAWLKNFKMNGISANVPAVTLQMMISEMYRDKNNPRQQFRHVIGKGKAGPRDYHAANVNEISAYSSTMSSLSFERFSEKLTTSLITSKENIKQQISPVEKVLLM